MQGTTSEVLPLRVTVKSFNRSSSLEFGKVVRACQFEIVS